MRSALSLWLASAALVATSVQTAAADSPEQDAGPPGSWSSEHTIGLRGTIELDDGTAFTPSLRGRLSGTSEATYFTGIGGQIRIQIQEATPDGTTAPTPTGKEIQKATIGGGYAFTPIGGVTPFVNAGAGINIERNTDPDAPAERKNTKEVSPVFEIGTGLALPFSHNLDIEFTYDARYGENRSTGKPNAAEPQGLMSHTVNIGVQYKF